MKKKILFVDDDEKILSGLKLALRKYRREWDIVTAESGQEALDKLSQTDFDCIVSDMKMPGMDGAEFLKQAKDKIPSTKRFILSGHADDEHIMESLPVTHQFLSKPCGADEIVGTLKRSFELDLLIDNAELKDILNNIESLPCRPVIYAKLNQQLKNENSSIDDIANIISEDIGISTKILQVVNSAFFALAQNMSSIQSAASYLGIGTTKNLVLMYESAQTFDLTTIKDFSIESEYDHSLLIANIAKSCFKDKAMSEEAFSAGILSRVGRLVLAQYMPDIFQSIVDQQKNNQSATDQIESDIAGVTHGQIGAYLLGVWGLPLNVINGLAYQHKPWEFEHEEFHIMDALYIARKIDNNPALLDLPAEELLQNFDNKFLNTNYIKTDNIIDFCRNAEDVISRKDNNE